jgi:hypothetical protein
MSVTGHIPMGKGALRVCYGRRTAALLIDASVVDSALGGGTEVIVESLDGPAVNVMAGFGSWRGRPAGRRGRRLAGRPVRRRRLRHHHPHRVRLVVGPAATTVAAWSTCR